MATKPNREVGRLQAVAVRLALLKRGGSLTELAAATGIPRKSFSARLSGGDLPLWAQARVEQVFGFTEPIWSSPRELSLRAVCWEKTKIDPGQLSLPELRDFAVKLGITTIRLHDKRAAVLGAILDHAAAHPKSLQV